ncbi:hypothetical protein [Goodfellowiella coeruleoviolacea]|uniref:DUF8017 domain-containing protein n=1 Tax=Goodfellowiella coeruleoviolacea TaxID=334858 RepID=A0AAE3KPA6_9PSEU|nr:hypothetical protein [Goodfellowiella coeruleoviolacea]MCP2169628.1 hypothetical protein [Goodfellowiella coeruleoviolacea]
MTYPGDGQSGWGGQSGQGGWGQQADEPTGSYTGPYATPSGEYTSSYGGLGAFSGNPAPPEQKPPGNRRNTVVALSALVLVLILGGTTALILINRNSETSAAGESSSTASAPSTTSSSRRTSATTTPGSAESSAPELVDVRPVVPGWQAVPVPELQIAADLPPNWKTDTPYTFTAPGYSDAEFKPINVFAEYSCGDKTWNRGSSGATKIEKSGDVKTVASTMVKAIAEDFYEDAKTTDVKVGEAKAVTRTLTDADGTITVNGIEVTAVATTTGNQCLASKGQVSLLLLEGKEFYVAYLVNGDLEGGPADQPVMTQADLQKIVDNVRPVAIRE